MRKYGFGLVGLTARDHKLFENDVMGVANYANLFTNVTMDVA